MFNRTSASYLCTVTALPYLLTHKTDTDTPASFFSPWNVLKTHRPNYDELLPTLWLFLWQKALMGLRLYATRNISKQDLEPSLGMTKEGKQHSAEVLQFSFPVKGSSVGDRPDGWLCSHSSCHQTSNALAKAVNWLNQGIINVDYLPVQLRNTNCNVK